jgi:2,3-bisphosphoglycerate-dependent phosphoglycerate mutase
MRNTFLVIFVCLVCCSCSRTVYVVRHAEKITATDTVSKAVVNDPPLSDAGKVRAIVLKDEMAGKHIRHIYSTNTVRTMSTAEPLSREIHVNREAYNNTDSLVALIKNTKGNILVIAHSNTIDDIINKLCGKKRIMTDLKETEYDNLFVIRFRGRKISFAQRKYGYASNP